MKAARRMAITSIFVTHDLKESLVVGDRFALLENGDIPDETIARGVIRIDIASMALRRILWGKQKKEAHARGACASTLLPGGFKIPSGNNKTT